MNKLSKLSIVIPTINRQKYALQQMIYWSSTKIPIYILDGSKEPMDYNSYHLGNNIHYYHLPISKEERIYQSTKFIKTPYVMFLCDDEFLIINTLTKCIDYLDDNRDFISCGGRCFGFHQTAKGVMINPIYINMKSHVNKDPTIRMTEHMNPYVPSFHYSMLRTDIWKNNIIDINCQYDVSVPSFINGSVFEVLFELYTCYQGKSMIIDDIMSLRNMMVNPIDCIQPSDRISSLKVWYNLHLTGTKKNITDSLIKSINSYLIYCKEKSLKIKVSEFKNQLMHLLPIKFREMITTIYINNRWKPISETTIDGMSMHINKFKFID